MVALVVLSVAQSLRAGKYRAAGAELVINAIVFVTAPEEGPVVGFLCALMHSYYHTYIASRPRVVDFGRAPRLG